jgi:hypothetical protein
MLSCESEGQVVTLDDVTSNLLAGVIASLATFAMVRLWSVYRDRAAFGWLAGQYDHYSIDGVRLEGLRTEIRYSGSGMLRLFNEGPDTSWVGTTRMDSRIPDLGSGVYQYKDRPDCGTHQIQINYIDKSIFVLSTNTSHGKSTTTSYVLRKRDSRPTSS